EWSAKHCQQTSLLAWASACSRLSRTGGHQLPGHARLEAGRIDAPHKGAHLFRHSLATGMLGQGASLAEIGELLGHRSPKTTTIYAKVDLGSLRTLALPWPGGER